MSATLYGLGVGPGDPDLLTLKAHKILRDVPVVAYPAPEGGESLVRAIAAPHIPAGRTEIVISTPMTAARFPAQEVYDRYAVEICGHLEAGRDVAVLCEGDPFLYGSFMYLFDRIAATHPTVVVPGVSSIAAVAAVTGKPLASRNEVLTVIPAPLAETELERRLAATDAAAIMKVGSHLAKVRRVLRRLDLERDAWYVERATMGNQKVVPLHSLGDDPAPYFSTILVRRPASLRTSRAMTSPSVPTAAAIVALTRGGMVLARRINGVLPESRIHGLAGRVEAADVAFTDTADHLRSLFGAGIPIVGICAAGILIRALAPMLADKGDEPPVVALAEDGSSAVPLLGGHRGANPLARALASALGGTAAITTGGDLRFGFGLDDPPPGWRIANPEAAKGVTAALLAGEAVALRVEAGDASWLRRFDTPFSDEGPRAVRITDRAVADPCADLILHPPVLAVGIGCERGVEAEEVRSLVSATLRSHGLAEGAVACVTSLDLKADETAVHAAAGDLGVPARFFSAEELEALTPRLANPSEIVYREVGCHGVAEASALAAAGPDGELVVEKTRSRRATCAVARSQSAIDASRCGRPRGRLSIVGIGPGDAALRTAETTGALAGASDVVGYGLYLDLVADLIAGKAVHASPLSEEENRVRMALDLAAEGRTVALISSGDAGIYGMAALVFEVIDLANKPAWNRIEVSVVPGISAFQIAAARLGAPMGHDFCAISLSDLLTPWPDIERRLRAAAEADFVVALYNPVSMRRRIQLATARDILLGHRPPNTPVAVARNLARAGESVDVITLADLNPGDVDMLTLVVVGNSHTRSFELGDRRWVYTPRGYEAKRAPEDRADEQEKA